MSLTEMEDGSWGACMIVQWRGLFLAIAGHKGLCFPGGKNRQGESPYEAAVRELSEEAGVSMVPAELHIGRIPPLVADPVFNGLTYGFVFQLFDDRTAQSLVSSDEGIACWVTYEALIRHDARFPDYNGKAITFGLFRRWLALPGAAPTQ